MAISPISRGRARPTGGRGEAVLWYLMRLTGVALFVLALAHFSIMHFIWDPADQDVAFIAGQRWNQLFWRSFDWLLLMTVLFHSFMGMRTVLGELVSRPRARRVVLSGLYLLGIALFAIGTLVVLTLPGLGGATESAAR